MNTPSGTTAASSDYFEPTLWSVVFRAQQGDSTVAQKALNQLCEIYRYPIYTYIRRRTPSPHDAEDLTQAYFLNLLERGYVREATPERGLFRAFLLHDLKFFLSNQRALAASAKRGGGKVIISLDAAIAEAQAGVAPDESPEAAFDRGWAQQVLERVMTGLHSSYMQHAREPLFEALKQFIGWNAGSDSYAAVAARLGKSEGYIKVNVHRLRERFRELLRLEVSQTIAPEGDVDGEIRYLAACLR